jgi:dipeptidyl aminopeptidase/acylaminoacyl peptidase
MKRSALVLLMVAATARAEAPHPFGFDDLIRARRVGGFDVSRDGRLVAYTLTTMDVAENRSTSAIWVQPLEGGEPHQLTAGRKHDRDPAFAPDGRALAFVSDRDGEPQIYLIDLAGGEARALTHLAAGADGPRFSPDGKFLLAVSEVFPDCATDACNRERAERMDKSKSSGRVIERLLFRHWDTWREGRRSHVFRVDVPSGDARDLTPGPFDAPPFQLGGGLGYDVSPDGKTVVFASNHDRVEALSTNSDLWEVASTGGKPQLITGDNPAWDGTPRFSPDGRSLAWRMQRVPGYESDRFELAVMDRKTRAIAHPTERFDGWVEDFAWSPDSQRLYFASTTKARAPIYVVEPAGSVPAEWMPAVTASDLHATAGGVMVFASASLDRPLELARATRTPRGPEVRALTHVNDALFEHVQIGPVRERWIKTSDGKQEQALVVLPPGFDEKRRYPALLWVHGGPQGAWEQSWSYRWNPHVLASAGYVVYLPNPRGSVGYGQDFVRGVSSDWGGQVFDDLMRAADDLESLPFVQKGKIGAAGASFGGFMINWFQGHTDRFRALFCHDGISDQQAMYATEELWFPEFEFHGTPWESPEYKRASPIEAAANFKTPELIVHGERDYRIPVEQALLMYTLLQRRGVPSKLLLFPDENHWVLKPANARLWYATMIDWFHTWLGGAPADAKALDSARSVTR